MKEFLFVFFVGVLALGLQVSSVGLLVPAAYKPDLMLATVVWATLRVPFAAGAGYAFVAGFMVSALSGAPTALFSLIYCIVLSLCWYLNVTFQVDRPSGWILLLLVGAWFEGAAILSARLALEPGGPGLLLIGRIVTNSIATAIGGEVLMLAMDRLSTGYSSLLG